MAIKTKKIMLFDYNNKQYEALINESLLKEVNYEWNSYNFIDKDYVFMTLRELSSNNIITLTTCGHDIDFIVRDLKTNEEIMDWDKILELSKNKKLHDRSTEYSVEDGNWFSIDFLKSESKNDNYKLEEEYNAFVKNNNLEYIDSDASYFAPENFEKLIEFLIDEYEKFFNR